MTPFSPNQAHLPYTWHHMSQVWGRERHDWIRCTTKFTVGNMVMQPSPTGSRLKVTTHQLIGSDLKPVNQQLNKALFFARPAVLWSPNNHYMTSQWHQVTDRWVAPPTCHTWHLRGWAKLSFPPLQQNLLLRSYIGLHCITITVFLYKPSPPPLFFCRAGQGEGKIVAYIWGQYSIYY